MPTAVQLTERPPQPAEKPAKKRVEILDILRGLGILYVVLYHVLYDIQYMFFPSADCGIFELDSLFMRFTHILFVGGLLFFISGICTGFSRSVAKRGLFLLALGELLTLGTYIFAPDLLIRFGVMTFFGASMLIYAALRPLLSKIGGIPLAVIWLTLFFIFRTMPYDDCIRLPFLTLNIPETLHSCKFLYPLGITYKGFHSADYFPLIPYIFLFLSGTAISPLIISHRDNMPAWCMKRLPFLSFCGRHSLVIYFAHQPIAFGILYILSKI